MIKRKLSLPSHVDRGSPRVMLHWIRSNIKTGISLIHDVSLSLLFLTQFGVCWQWEVEVCDEGWNIIQSVRVPLVAGAKIILYLGSCRASTQTETMNDWRVPGFRFRVSVDWVLGNVHDSASQRQLRTDSSLVIKIFLQCRAQLWRQKCPYVMLNPNGL